MLTKHLFNIIILVVSKSGRIAQLGEHLPYKQGVIGSSPIVPTTFFGLVVQLVRTPPCHGGGRGFESHPGRHFFIYGQIAQLVEQGTENPRVGGSIPSLATNAGIAQLIERRVANAKVAGLSPVSRSTKTLNNVFFYV